jgi:hypothetical protein
VVQNDLLELFAKAITCAVLAKAGPQRVRVIDMLQKVDKPSPNQPLPSTDEFPPIKHPIAFFIFLTTLLIYMI